MRDSICEDAVAQDPVETVGSWGNVVEKYGPMIRRYVYRRIKDYQRFFDPADVEQRVFMALMKSIASFDPTRGVRFSTWLIGMARKQLSSMIRKAKRWAREQPLSALECGSEEGAVDDQVPCMRTELPPDICCRRETIKAVDAAINGLPMNQGDVVRLIYFHGRTFREAAATLHTPLGTICKRMRAAKRQLHAQLRPWA